MFHDRVAFGGALIAIGWLYLWLVQFPLKDGEPWAWWAFVLSGLAGFGSFLAYLGYGYLDSWHGVATLFLLPTQLLGLVISWPHLKNRAGPQSLLQPAAKPSLRTRFGLGRALLLSTGAGLVLGGLTICFVGMTHVFVPQDLRYIGMAARDFNAINPRLVPLIAHDRAGFGGGLATCGLILCCCVWCGRPSRSLWQAVALAGGTGFLTAIGVHPLIGYTDFTHLAPAYLGAVIFLAGIALCRKPMCRGEWARPPELSPATSVLEERAL
jgi:hypothetical protein